jgi:hypothetical protein
MQEKSALSNPCETAAGRVQYWFGKDKANLLQREDSSFNPQEFCKKYKCDPVKPPRFPSQVKGLPLQDDVLKKKKQTKSRCITQENTSKLAHMAVDCSYCNANQKNFHHLSFENPLSSERVVYLNLKEHFLVSRWLKMIAKQPQTGPKRHLFILIKSSPQEDLPENSHLQEWRTVQKSTPFPDWPRY